MRVAFWGEILFLILGEIYSQSAFCLLQINLLRIRRHDRNDLHSFSSIYLQIIPLETNCEYKYILEEYVILPCRSNDFAKIF